VIVTRYNGMIQDFVLLNGILPDPEPEAANRQMSTEIKAPLVS
jgi:acetyl esterase